MGLPTALALTIIVGGCAAPATPDSIDNARSTPATTDARSAEPPIDLPAELFAGGETAIPALLQTEREAIQRGDLHTLAHLWTADARIIDGRTTHDPGDDYHWQGRDAILDRYVVAVFPAPPPLLENDDLHQIAAQLVIEDSWATLNYGVDSWRFVRQDNRWWLQELRYN